MRSVIETVIASGSSVSPTVDLGLDGSMAGLIMPAAWTTAAIQIEGSMDGANFSPMFFEDGNLVGFTVPAAGQMLVLNPAKAVPARYIRLRSGTSASPVNQGAARTIQVLSRKFC